MIGQSISHYVVLEELGAGGMGVVYKAKDARLHRFVALKFVASRLADDPRALERLRREACAASALNHPNICTVYDFGEHQGHPFLVMEYLEGRPLSLFLRGKPLETNEILRLGIQIAEGLEAAHSKGVIHRDIKPSNVFVTTTGQVKILDFGLAKSLPEPDVTLSKAFTEPQTVLGTLLYMAPEQVLGKQVDHRADLWSFGVLLYEMATGLPAFQGQTSAAITDAILHSQPSPPCRLNHALPASFDRVVAKALEKNSQLRYQSASESKADLTRLERDSSSAYITSMMGTRVTRFLSRRKLKVSVFLVLVVIIALLGWFLKKVDKKATSAISERITIAVLPFHNASLDKSLDYLTTALPDEAITTLSHAPPLSVRPFSMSQAFVGDNVDPHRAGEQLRVKDVVTGHFLREGDRLNVTLEGVDVANYEVAWRDSFDVPANNMLTLRQQLAGSLQKGLLPVLGVSNVQLSVTKPKSQEAYELYLRAQDNAYWSMERNNDAIALLEKSVALDPGYAPAWLALGLHYSNEADFGSGGEGMYNKTVAALERTHQLDPDLLIASTILIETRAFYEDLATSFEGVQELARKWPHRAEVHLAFSEVLRAAGALEEAERECEATHQLDPDLYTGPCYVLYIHIGNLAKARQEIERSPGDFSTMMMGQVLLREGRINEALPKLKLIPGGKNYELIRDCWPDSSTSKCAQTARESEASFRIIPFTDAWYFGAAIQALVGKKDAAVRLLRAASEHGLCVYPSVDRDPLFDKIRRSTEFQGARQTGIECQNKFASYARIQIQ